MKNESKYASTLGKLTCIMYIVGIVGRSIILSINVKNLEIYHLC